MHEVVIALAGGGALLHDAALPEAALPQWFDREHWLEHGAVGLETSGRGSVLIVDRGSESWVLRHYRRGGLIARFIDDHYLWLGRDRTRSFREWRLLARLQDLGLPAPKPVAAAVHRAGPIYTADIITVYLPGTRKLSAYIAAGAAPAAAWPEAGRIVAALHNHGVDHPDLTAHNLLLDEQGKVFVVDFDNAAIRPPGRWQEAGVGRLQRSLRKVALETGTQFDAAAWHALERAYREARAPGVRTA
jgi:3-deoxy-D-manno-octulosonic acid kinase